MLRPVAVQLYSLREQAEKDFVAVLKKVADIGYQAVEPAGFWNLRPSEFKKIIDDLGLKMYSSHSPWARPNNLGECMEIASILGLDKIVCGYGPEEFRDMDAIKRTAEQTSKMAEIVGKQGFTLFQHNHYWEFDRLDGRIKYDIYAELCPKVKFEIDSFWSTNFGAEDPVAMLKLFGDRVILLHMKDGSLKRTDDGLRIVNGIYDNKADLRPLGTGDLPIADLIAAAPATVGSVVVELDYCNTEMVQALEISYRFVTSSGLLAGNK